MKFPMALHLVTPLIALASENANAQTAELWTAIERGQLATVEEYLNNQGNPNIEVNRPPLETGVPQTQLTEPPWPLLKLALYDREEDIALALLDAGADFDSSDVSLGLVGGNGMARVLQYLLTQDSSRLRDALPDQQRAMLSEPVSKGYHLAVEVLLTGARRIGFTWDPVVLAETAVLAIDDRQFNIARMLFDAGARVDYQAILVAGRSGSPGLIRYLFGLGANPNSQLPEELVNPGLPARTALDFASLRFTHSVGREREIAAMVMFELRRAGATTTTTEAQVDDAPKDGLAELARIADPEERLIEAARLGYYQVVEETVQFGRPSKNALREATEAALRSLNNDVAFFLITAGAPLDEGPLHAAAAGNSPGLTRAILRSGVDPNERVDGFTPAESWWERAQQSDMRAAGDLVLHELISGGADVCWLVEHNENLNIFAQTFLRYTATRCWPNSP